MHHLFKFLLNNYKNFIYMNTNRIKINLWSFIHIHILYLYQRTSIMVWLNTISGLSSKFIKTLKMKFDFISLYRSTIMYLVFIIILLFII